MTDKERLTDMIEEIVDLRLEIMEDQLSGVYCPYHRYGNFNQAECDSWEGRCRVCTDNWFKIQCRIQTETVIEKYELEEGEYNV